VSHSLRRARNGVIHGLATRPASVQRTLIEKDTRAHASGRWEDQASDPTFEEMLESHRESDRQALGEVEIRTAALCDWHIRLVSVGSMTFELEYLFRRNTKA
jgi:hypothetical protein